MHEENVNCLVKSDQKAFIDVKRPTVSVRLFDELLAAGLILDDGCPKQPLVSPKINDKEHNKFDDFGTGQNQSLRIVFYGDEVKKGEQQGASYLAKAAQNLGHDWIYISQQSNLRFDWVKRIQPDHLLVLSINAEVIPAGRHRNTLFAHQANKNYYENWEPHFDNLQAIGFSSQKQDEFRQELTSLYPLKNVPSDVFSLYFSVPSRPYKQLKFDTVFYAGMNWDKKRRDGFADIYKMLDQKGALHVYGPASSWEGHGLSGYEGALDFQSESIIKAIQRAGICLVFHSEGHIQSGMPSARVFEAAAASAMIISDRHPFVEAHFSDCVLFIDESKPVEDIKQQITKHIDWIQNHPGEAAQMAKKANHIMNTHFSAEKQIQTLVKQGSKEKPIIN